MNKRKIGFFEAMTQEWTEAGEISNLKFSLEGLQKALVVLVALSALLILSGWLDGDRTEYQVVRWLSWIWMVSWAGAVVAIREEVVARRDWEEQKDLPYLD